MVEARIAFLCRAASIFPVVSMNKTEEKLRSYYRMRCKEISKGYGLPEKHFSERVMCTHCCLEWKKRAETKVRCIKLSKRQRKRMKAQNKIGKNIKLNVLHSNQIDITCSFCKNTTKTIELKPNKPIITKSEQPTKEIKALPRKVNEKVNTKVKEPYDIYNNTIQVFSLNNKKNILKSTIKEPKIIKNNKKKKDKFAGLCQKAVLMSAHLKQDKLKQNKLSLFLKPSS